MAPYNPPVDSKGRVCPGNLHVRDLIDWSPFTSGLRKQAHQRMFEENPILTTTATDDVSLGHLTALSGCDQTVVVAWQPAKRRGGRTGWYRVSLYLHRCLCWRNVVNKARLLRGDDSTVDELDSELDQMAMHRMPLVVVARWISPDEVTFKEKVLAAAPKAPHHLSYDMALYVFHQHLVHKSVLAPDCATLTVISMLREEGLMTVLLSLCQQCPLPPSVRADSLYEDARAFRRQLHNLVSALS